MFALLIFAYFLAVCYNYYMEKTVRIVSFQEAEELDIQYWKKATPEEKLDTLQALREIYYTFKNENRKRLQRVYRIVEQK